jgi:hypothetical protein
MFYYVYFSIHIVVLGVLDFSYCAPSNKNKIQLSCFDSASVLLCNIFNPMRSCKKKKALSLWKHLEILYCTMNNLVVSDVC